MQKGKQLIIVLLFVSYHSFSQFNANDSLWEYSYLVAPLKDTMNTSYIMGVTTGFFIKQNEDLYFLTAYHTFTQTNSTSDIHKGYISDYLRIRIIDSFKLAWYDIDIRKIVKEAKPILFYKKPDIYAYKMSKGFLDTIKQNHVKIYSIENIAAINKDKTNTSVEAISFGYPTYQDGEKVDLKTRKGMFYRGYIVTNPAYSIVNGVRIDSLNDLLSPMTFNGASGSPLFYLYKRQDESGNLMEWIEFAGAVVARDTTYNYTAVLKKQFVFDQLKK